jgi:hypothetical protein
MNINHTIQADLRARGISVAPCEIAHVMADEGLTKRIAYNRIDPNRRVRPCRPAKRPAILAALRRLGLLEADHERG